MDFRQPPRALTTANERPPFDFHVWLAGAWGMESCAELSSVLHRVPRASERVFLDCRRITLIDGMTMQTMSRFAHDCAERDVRCTFECDEDPVGRLIALAGLHRLHVLHRPLVSRPAH